MAITKIQSESLNLADTYAFTGTVTGAGGDNKPSFKATNSADQTLNDNSWTKVSFNTETYDTDTTYDHSSNYRWTPGIVGKVYISFVCAFDTVGSQQEDRPMQIQAALYKNGSRDNRFRVAIADSDGGINNLTDCWLTCSGIVETDADDYFEVYAYSNNEMNHNDGRLKANSMFSGFKIIT